MHHINYLLAALLVPLVSGCNVGAAKDAVITAPTGSAVRPVEVVTPRKHDIFASYDTTSSITSDADAPVLARVDGEVVEILVEEGDIVTAGQVLARLDGERLRLELQYAQALLSRITREYERNLQLQQKNLVSAAVVEGLRYDLESLKASYALKKLEHSYTTIRAPIAGVVSSRDIKIGQHVDVNGSAFCITDTTRLVAHLKIPQNELGKFAAGHSAEVRVDAMPEQVFAASIARISPTIDATNGTFRATAYVDNQRGLLAPGMFGRFRIAYEHYPDALTIPATAVVIEDNEAVVYVVQDGAAIRRAVTTGIEVNGVIQVTAGLAEDEQIIVSGQSGLRDGSKVLASIPAKQHVSG
jgi:membrane fusion protein (multidrug efflux system)